jgi:hypothetical protein
MFLREPLQPLPQTRGRPVRLAIGICAILTLAFGIYPTPLLRAVQAAVPPRSVDVFPTAIPPVQDDP